MSKKSISLALIFMSFFCMASAKEKMYIDPFELNMEEGSIRIHTMDNIWIECEMLHRDETGFFIFNNDIRKDSHNAHEKSWKCPYCFRFWPVGKPCQNPDCPSKY